MEPKKLYLFAVDPDARTIDPAPLSMQSVDVITIEGVQSAKLPVTLYEEIARHVGGSDDAAVEVIFRTGDEGEPRVCFMYDGGIYDRRGDFTGNAKPDGFVTSDGTIVLGRSIAFCEQSGADGVAAVAGALEWAGFADLFKLAAVRCLKSAIAGNKEARDVLAEGLAAATVPGNVTRH